MCKEHTFHQFGNRLIALAENYREVLLLCASSLWTLSFLGHKDGERA